MCASHRYGPLFTIAVALGLRLGEVLDLRSSDVDLEKGELRVRQALQQRKGGVLFVEPKSKPSRRTLSLPVVPKAILDKHHRH